MASRRRRLGSLAYEAILLVAVLFVAGFILVPLAQPFPPAARRHALQLALLAVVGVYSVAFWSKGYTLPMKTWGIRLVRADGRALTQVDAFLRFIFAIPSVGLVGVGFLWSLLDREKQFLHDRWAGTRLIDTTTTLEPENQSNTVGEQ